MHYKLKMNYLLPFLAVVLGYGIVILFQPERQRYIKLLLSFSGAYLLALTVFVLLPEVYNTHNEATGRGEVEGHDTGTPTMRRTPHQPFPLHSSSA